MKLLLRYGIYTCIYCVKIFSRWNVPKKRSEDKNRSKSVFRGPLIKRFVCIFIWKEYRASRFQAETCVALTAPLDHTTSDLLQPKWFLRNSAVFKVTWTWRYVRAQTKSVFYRFLQDWLARTASVWISFMTVGAENSAIYIRKRNRSFHSIKTCHVLQRTFSANRGHAWINKAIPSRKHFSGTSDSRETKREVLTELCYIRLGVIATNACRTTCPWNN